MSEWSNKTVYGLFQYTSSTACQNGVTRLFWIVPVLVVQRVSSNKTGVPVQRVRME